MSGSSIGPALIALASVLAPTVALAQQSARPAAQQTSTPSDPRAAQARAAFEQGVAMSQQERWGEALDAFRRSFDLVPRPSTAFNMASTLVRLGRHVEAIAAYEHYLRIADAATEGARFLDAQQQLANEQTMIARIVLSTTPADATVRLDGRALEGSFTARELSVDIGEHTIEASAPHFRAGSTRVRVASGERAAITLALDAITTAHLEVVPSVSSAVVSVDGQRYERGAREIAAGPHEVVVTAAGYEPFRRRVTLAPEATLRVDATLTRVQVQRPVYASPLFWAAVAGGAAVITTGVVLGVVLSSQAPEFNTSTGITIQALSGGARF